MHAFIMLHNLNHPEMRLWIRHILDIVLLVFIMKSQGSFLPCLQNTLFSSLPNFFFSIAFKACILLAPVCHFIFSKSSFESVPPKFTSESPDSDMVQPTVTVRSL